MRGLRLPLFLSVTLVLTSLPASLSLAQPRPLDEAVLGLARERQIQLAYAPELLEGLYTQCQPLPAADADAFRCLLDGTGLRLDTEWHGVYVIYRPHPMERLVDARTTAGAIAGRIDRADGAGLPGVNLKIVGLKQGAASAPDGTFYIAHVPPGTYDLDVSMVGYERHRISGIRVAPGDSIDIALTMTETTLELGEMVVTARSWPGLPDLETLTAGVARFQGMQVGPVAAGLLISATDTDTGRFQFGGLAAMSRDTLHGAQMAGLFNTAAHASNGMQLGGIYNQIDGSLVGAQLGGIMNLLVDDLRGAQLAGVANQAGGTVTGVQGSGTINVAMHAVRGVQMAGAVNIASAAVQGAQAAGAFNRAGETTGFQAAGVANLATHLHGAQIAGLANVASGTARGAQIGVLNAAGSMTGLQLGVVNVANSLQGVPIGLFSYVRTYGLRYDAWVDETGTLAFAIRSGNGVVANYIGISSNDYAPTTRLGVLMGLGLSHSFGSRVFASWDWLYAINGLLEGENEHRTQLRSLLGVRITPGVSLFAGPSINAIVTDSDTRPLPIPWEIEQGAIGDGTYRIWPGFSAGMRFSLRR